MKCWLLLALPIRRNQFGHTISTHQMISARSSATHNYKTTTINMNRNWSSVISMAAGVGLLAGTTSVLLYHYLLGRRYVFVLEQDLNHLHLSLANLKFEFEQLKNLKQQKRKGSRRSKNISTGSTTSFTDASMYSAVESDLEDDFCDVSNSEDDTTFKSMSLASFSSYKTAMSSAASPPANEDQAGQLSHLDKLLEGNDDDKLMAENSLLQLIQNTPNDCEILWRLAKVSHALGCIEGAKGDSKKKEQHIFKGIEYGQEALNSDPNSCNAHKWYAICVGARGQFSGTKEKILDGIKFKEHIEKALALDDSDPTLHNLLARFEFEVSTLSSMERRVAGWLFAQVPTGTVENAISGFEKTERLNPKPWKENRLLLAKCYIHQKKYDVAVKWLDKALQVTPVNSEEMNFDEEIKKLLKKYESYRQS